MAHSLRVGAHDVYRIGPSSLRDLVQVHADDVVLAAALFKPNAAGSHELSPGAGFRQRQLLKARGAYLGERVVIGVTALSVHAVVLFFGGRGSRAVGCWPRADMRAEPVESRDDSAVGSWPALLLTDRFRNVFAELHALHQGDEAWELFSLLLR